MRASFDQRERLARTSTASTSSWSFWADVQTFKPRPSWFPLHSAPRLVDSIRLLAFLRSRYEAKAQITEAWLSQVGCTLTVKDPKIRKKSERNELPQSLWKLRLGQLQQTKNNDSWCDVMYLRIILKHPQQINQRNLWAPWFWPSDQVMRQVLEALGFCHQMKPRSIVTWPPGFAKGGICRIRWSSGMKVGKPSTLGRIRQVHGDLGMDSVTLASSSDPATSPHVLW